MIPVVSLWLPILLSAILVFVISSIIHMFIGYHNTDFEKIPNEDQIMDSLRKASIPPGNYVLPYAANNKERKTQEFQDKINKGPVAFITTFPTGQFNMGSSLAQWFVYCLIVGAFAAYIAGRALEPGAHYLSVFRFVGATAFLSYSLALLQNSIWFRKNWSATLKSMFDGLIYALFTAGVFGWLWPAA